MTWRKSSRSGQDGNCVEVRDALDAIRDSKNPNGPALIVPVTTFVAALKAANPGTN